MFFHLNLLQSDFKSLQGYTYSHVHKSYPIASALSLSFFFFFFFFFFFAVDLLHSIFYSFWMIMKMGMIVNDAEEFPCGDGLRDRAVIHASYHNYP